jgi:acyl-CoA synthetase (AMP-forming)/AMP-acid ligase II
VTSEAPATLGHLLAAAWKTSPSAVALVTADRRTMTYGELARAATTLAGAYADLGIARGDRIVCSLRNDAEHVVAAAAAWTRGAVHVGADHDLTGAELGEYIHLTGATTLICGASADASNPWRPLREVQKRYPRLRTIVASGRSVPEGCLALDALMQGEAGVGFDEPAPDDPAAIFTTSGTTGRPKTPLGYHGRLVASWSRLARELDFGPADVHLVQLPLSHGLCLMLATAALIAGGRLVLLERFSPADALRTIAREQVTVLNGSPAHYRLLLDVKSRVPADLRSLRIGVASGGAFSPLLLQSIFDELDIELMLMYGSSEGVGVGTRDRSEMLAGFVGRPAPGSVVVVGADREPLAEGEVGEIAFSRKFFPVRYWGPTATTAMTSGWYYTGDRGRLDAEGRLQILGRLRHDINRGGMNIDPVEVENALIRSPDVADATAIGVPSPVLGETVCACVVPVKDRTPTLDALRSALRSELAPHKLPEELWILERIPRTGLGKVDLETLRAEALAASKGAGRPL